MQEKMSWAAIGRESINPRHAFTLAEVVVVPCLLGKGKADKPTPYVISVTVIKNGVALLLENKKLGWPSSCFAGDVANSRWCESGLMLGYIYRVELVGWKL